MNGRYEARYYGFEKKPKSDSCWALSTGPDGRIYAAACTELTGGEQVTVVRYDDVNDTLEYLVDVGNVVGDPPDSGRATQCKIHYSFAPSLKDGILYAATHLSGPPIGERFYSPWGSWYDTKRAFRGSALLAYDTVKDKVVWTDTFIPKEGCRCLALDDERETLYALSYPRDHFIIYGLKTRQRRDLGRIGSVNSQCIFFDSRKRVFFSDDRGHLVRYDPKKGILETLPMVLPHAFYQTGWHSVLYDAVASPDNSCIYIITWIANPQLIRFFPEEGEFGRIEDLGPLTQERDTTLPIDTFLDHAGGLIFGLDQKLYCVVSRWEKGMAAVPSNRRAPATGVVLRIDPNTLVKEEVAQLCREKASAHYVSRGARDRHGNLFFGHVGIPPVGLFKLTMPSKNRTNQAHLPLRMWG